MKPRFTVSTIIPAYNSEETIERAIESVISQTYPATEIIVVDDGSTDSTRHIVQKKFPQVKYIYQNNGGASAARNTGIKAATGEWIAFLDSDDIWLPRRLELQVKVLQKYPDVHWCAGIFFEKTLDGKVILRGATDKAKKILNHQDGIITNYYQARLSGAYVWTSTILLKKYIFLKVGMFNEELIYSEDNDIWDRIAERFLSIGYIISEPIAEYIRRNNSLISFSGRNEYSQTKLRSALHVAGSCSFYEAKKLNRLKTLYLREAYAHHAIRYFFTFGFKEKFKLLLRNSNGWVSLKWKIFGEIIVFFPQKIFSFLGILYFKLRQ